VAQRVNVKSGDRIEIQITDWRFLVRETRKVDPRLIETFKKNAKRIGRPVERAVQSGIPNRFPIRGMQPKVIPGRMTWGTVLPARATELKVDTRMRKKGKSIVSVWVNSPATAMGDLAKRGGRMDGKLTRVSPYSKSPTGKRRHTVNGQGRHMVAALAGGSGFKRSQPSRMVWPSAQQALPEVNAKMYALVEQTARQINAEIKRNA